MCFELASLWRSYKGIPAYADDHMNIVKKSFFALASVAVTSKNIDVPADLGNKNTMEICNDYFNAGNEKSRR